MIKTLTSAAFILAVFSLSPAEAGRRHFWWLDGGSPYQADQSFYADSDDDQEAYAQDQFNQEQYDLYMRQMRHKKKPRYEQAYYEPQVETPAYKPKLRVVKQKPVAKFMAPKPVVKPTRTKTGVMPITKRYETASNTKSISCNKGAGIVADYGFSRVTNKSCSGATFVYGATRSGKNFDIEVSAATGELTAVKKL
jgi:hypothetical protein